MYSVPLRQTDNESISGSGLASKGNKPLPGPMMTKFIDAYMRLHASTGDNSPDMDRKHEELNDV